MNGLIPKDDRGQSEEDEKEQDDDEGQSKSPAADDGDEEKSTLVRMSSPRQIGWVAAMAISAFCAGQWWGCLGGLESCVKEMWRWEVTGWSWNKCAESDTWEWSEKWSYLKYV